MKTKTIVSTLVLIFASTSIALAAETNTKTEQRAPASKKSTHHKKKHGKKSKVSFVQFMKEDTRDVAEFAQNEVEATKTDVIKLGYCDLIEKSNYVTTMTFHANSTFDYSDGDADESGYGGYGYGGYSGGGAVSGSGTWKVVNKQLNVVLEGKTRVVRFGKDTKKNHVCYINRDDLPAN